jgi:hypothetical protein
VTQQNELCVFLSTFYPFALNFFPSLNLSKPTGQVMHHQFNIQQLYAPPTSLYVFGIYLRTNSDLCHLQHKLIGFITQMKVLIQRGTDWVFN